MSDTNLQTVLITNKANFIDTWNLDKAIVHAAWLIQSRDAGLVGDHAKDTKASMIKYVGGPEGYELPYPSEHVQ